MRGREYELSSNNAHTHLEMRALLAGRNLISLAEAGVIAAPEETGETFEANALIKAEAACIATGLPAIADDSGLMVDALGGTPGVHSARYCPGSDADRVAFLLKNLAGIPEERRTARFVSAVACVFPDGRRFAVQADCPGVILDAPRGPGGFGYDPVFFYPPMNATFAEIGSDRKNSISHRGRALGLFIEKLDALERESIEDNKC
jgi:XTP/dITP diphosphohydrolase